MIFLNALVLTRGIEVDLVNKILAETDFDIEYAFVTSEREKNQIVDISNRVKNIYVCANGALWDECNLEGITYDVIQEYKDLETDFEDGTSRYVDDYNLVKILYYNALAFWERLFKKHRFDIVIMLEFTHGISEDCVPIAMAKKNKIPCYQIESLMYGFGGTYLNNTDEYIPTIEKSSGDIHNAMFYSLKTEDISQSKGVKKYIKKILYKVGGELLLRTVIDFFKKHTITEYIFNNQHTRHTLMKKYTEYFVFKNSYDFMKKSASNVNLNEKYIIYYLHYEPEASIMVRCPIKTQLLAIQMLSENLPDGWKLYVKEHPHQKLVNTKIFWDALFTIGKYKTRKFYQYILNLNNTYIVDPQMDSRKLTEHAEAIATYHGTVALESIKLKKPVIMFAANKSILRYTGEVLSVSSYADCRNAIQKVKAGWRPQYDNWEDKIQKYLIEWNDNGFTLAIRSIFKHFTR